jgi:uncharacterized membrane protein
VVLSGTFLIIRNARRQTDAADPDESLARDRRFRRLSSVFILGLGVFCLVLVPAVSNIGFLNGTKDDPNSALVVLAPVFVFLLATIALLWWLMFRVGQGGSRLRAPKDRKDETAVNYDDDRFWKLGLFYFNPDDPAVFVEKRFGLGWTTNFARPLVWLLILGLVAVSVGSVVLVALLG